MATLLRDKVQPFDFVGSLLEDLAESPPKRKGDLTRARIDVACARTLNRIAFNRVTVKDIAVDAGISSAAFYQYYDNKTDAASKVLTKFIFWATALITEAARGARGDLIAELTAGNEAWLGSARANAGLIHCLLQVSDSDHGFAAIYRGSNERFIARSAEALIRQASGEPGVTANPEEFRLNVYALSAMMDEMTRSLFVRQSPMLQQILKDTSFDDRRLAEALALIWYRTLFGRDPA